MASSFETTCLFCNEPFSSVKAMREHLFLCGNKTDACPKCRRFIRRAVFAYHFENNCADFDESTDSGRSKANSSDTGQMSETVTKKPIGSQGTPKMAKCEWCRADVLVEDYDRHKEKCYKRPKDFNQNRSFAHQHRDTTEVFSIQCEFCQKSIESSNFLNHQKTCSSQRKTAEQKNQRGHQQSTGQHQCPYCNKPYNDQNNYYIHQNTCPKNPERRSYAEAAGARRHPSSNS